MARKGRIKSSEGIYHTVLRAEDKLFFDDKDYLEFIDLLRRYFVDTDSKIYAYSLEKNRVHLVFFTPEAISTVMKPLCTSYARYINRTYNKSGKLFYDRYMSEPIEDNETLKKAIIFVNEHKKAKHTSKSAYSDKDSVCDISKFKRDIDEIMNPDQIYAFVDDYASMSDKELKEYILSLGPKNDKSLKKEELFEFALTYSNISGARVKRILNLTKPPKVEKAKKPEPKKEEPKKNNRNELSFWLL